MPNSLYAAARWYASRGWFVFPLAPHGKRPWAGSHGLLEATTDPEQIRKWWTLEPNANIGIATGPSGLCIVDVDPRHGGDESWFALGKDQTVPETLTVLTAGAGQHYYYRRGDNLVYNTAGELTSGVDIRALGGYVVVPPSVNGQGAWQWEIGHGPRDGILQPLPEWLATALTQRSNSSLDLSQDTPVIEGGRNHWLTRTAGKLRRLGLSVPELEMALEGINQQRCRPPLPKKEVTAIAKSIGVREAKEPITYDDPANLGIVSFADLRASSSSTEPWLIDALLRASGLLLLAGAPKAGKSTLARNLARSVASGGLFMGRQCTQGEVLWVGLEEPTGELLEALEMMEAGGLPIRYRVESFHRDQEAWLRAAIEQMRPALAIIDTIGSFTQLEDINSYSQVVRATKPLIDLRNKYGTSFCLNHHTNKHGTVLGSQYWTGAVDHTLVLTRNEEDETRFLKTVGMRGMTTVGIPTTALRLDHKTGIIAGCEVSQYSPKRDIVAEEEDLLMSYAENKGLFG